MLKGVLLSSSRLEAFRPLTYQTPLALLPLVDRPLVEHQIEFLARNGVSQVRLSCNHLGNRIEEHCGSGSLWGAVVSYSYEHPPFGALRALQRMKAFFPGSTLIILDGDVVADVDMARALEFHALHRADATFLCSLTSTPSMGLTLALDGGSRIRAVRLNSSPAASPHLADAGICILEPEMLELLPDSSASSVLQVCWEASKDVRLNLYGYRTGEPIHRLTGWRSYYKTHMEILEGRVPGIRIPGTEVQPGIWMGDNVRAGGGVVLEPPVLIGDGCVLGKNVIVGKGTVVGRFSSLEPGTTLERSLVLPRTRVASRAELSDTVIRGNLIIDIQRNTKRAIERALPPPAHRRGRGAAGMYRYANRLAAFLLLLLILPLLATTAVALTIRRRFPLVTRVRRLGVDLQALAAGALQLRVFDLFYLGPLAADRQSAATTFDPPTVLPRFFARMGNLLNVVTGDILLVGNRPMDPELAFSLTEEWERRRFTCQTGFISVLDSLDAGRLTDLERCVTEANYAVYRTVRTDLTVLWKTVRRCLASHFRHQPVPVMLSGGPAAEHGGSPRLL